MPSVQCHQIGRSIQSARSAKGITQKTLAQQIGEKQSVVSEYEAGRKQPTTAMIRKIERALGTKLV